MPVGPRRSATCLRSAPGDAFPSWPPSRRTPGRLCAGCKRCGGEARSFASHTAMAASHTAPPSSQNPKSSREKLGPIVGTRPATGDRCLSACVSLVGYRGVLHKATPTLESVGGAGNGADLHLLRGLVLPDLRVGPRPPRRSRSRSPPRKRLSLAVVHIWSVEMPNVSAIFAHMQPSVSALLGIHIQSLFVVLPARQNIRVGVAVPCQPLSGGRCRGRAFQISQSL